MNLRPSLTVNCHIAHLLRLPEIINDKIRLKPVWDVLLFYLLLNKPFVMSVATFSHIMLLLNLRLYVEFLSLSQHKLQILRIIIVFVHIDMSFLIALILQLMRLSQIYQMVILMNLVKNIFQVMVQYNLFAAFLSLRLFFSYNAEIIDFKNEFIWI